MPAVIIVVIVVVVVAAIAFLVTRRSPAGSARAGGESLDAPGPRAPYREFHVAGSSAMVYFDVPLPEGEIDPVLADLLVREAVDILRDKQSHDLPLEDVTEVKAFGIRDGRDVEAGSLSLEAPGAFPEIDHIEIVPHYSSVPFDPLARLGEHEHPVSSGESAAPARGEDVALEPLAEELALTGRVEAGLRAQGVDPATMGAGDLALGLMRMAGYGVQAAASPDAYIVSSPGSRTFVQIVPHGPGDYPELGEREIKQFQVGLASAGADRGMLITEKFGPYLIYDAERRNPKAKFITRERLQHFVDSFSMS